MVASRAQRKVPTQMESVSLKGGGGIHTRASEEDIHPLECFRGANFDLDPYDTTMRPRAAIQLVGRAPNGKPIRGMASFISEDDTVYAGVQAGDAFYRVNQDGTFTFMANVNEASRMRGSWRDHYWALDDKILITDLAKAQGIMEWDGSTMAPVVFKKTGGAGFGFFSAKYLKIDYERAFYSNVSDGTGSLPSLIIGSQSSNFDVISVDDRPSSALGEGDPFFVQSPDLRDVNGSITAFETPFISTKNGSMFRLNGENSQEFSFTPFYQGSSASGAEAIAWAGSDVFYGKNGVIESLSGVDRYGSVEATAISNPIKDDIKDLKEWTVVYNDRLKRCYFFATGSSVLWAFYKPMILSQLSPWSPWQTKSSIAFQPSSVMSVISPITGVETVWMGDNDGNLYSLDGGEAAVSSVEAVDFSRLSKLFSFDSLDATIYNVRGYVKYRKSTAFDINLDFLYSGTSLLDENVMISVGAQDQGLYYGDQEESYYGGGYYGQPFEGRLTKQRFGAAGGDDISGFQIEARVSGAENFAIGEIYIEFEAVPATASI